MPNLNDILRDHVTLEVECIDRLYLGAYVPTLQTSGALVNFMRIHRGKKIPSPAILQQISADFCQRLEAFAEAYQIPFVHFERNERKDDVAKRFLQDPHTVNGVLFIGVAQEKARAFKATKAKDRDYVSFSFSKQWVYVNHYYFYLVDEDFGPGFIKVCAYAPYPMKIYLNGHEWAKRQLQKESIVFEALDNGLLSCPDPKRLQAICSSLGKEQIQTFFDKWLEILPLPLTEDDRSAGYRHRLSVQQMEMSLTQVLDAPEVGRAFFEDLIRENLDIGRPDRIRLIFGRKIIASTPGAFHTEIVTEGVLPCLHFRYKHTLVKLYFKENRALRTETTINNPYDFYVKKDISHLARLKSIGRHANRRVIDVIRLSHQSRLSASSFQNVVHPSRSETGQRAPAFRFGDRRVMALFGALNLTMHRPSGLTHRTLRPYVAELLGPNATYGRGQMTYDLRRLRQKKMITRLPNTNRYTLTTYGRVVSLFFTRLDRRIFDTVFAAIDHQEPVRSPLTRKLDGLNTELDRIFQKAQLVKAA
jgi:hypothetical protein